MPPTTHRLDDNDPGTEFRFPREAGLQHDNEWFIAVRNAESHGEFHLVSVWLEDDGKLVTKLADITSIAYYPIHPKTKPEDVMGATHAWSDGTYWHFAHSTPGQHHDWAALTEALVITSFHTLLHSRLRKVATATNTEVQHLATKSLDAMEDFVDEVRSKASRIVLAHTLGHHNFKREDQHRKSVVEAIDFVLKDWKTRGLKDAPIKAKRALVLSDVNNVRTSLNTVTALKTAAQKRQEAEDEQDQD